MGQEMLVLLMVRIRASENRGQVGEAKKNERSKAGREYFREGGMKYWGIFKKGKLIIGRVTRQPYRGEIQCVHFAE